MKTQIQTQNQPRAAGEAAHTPIPLYFHETDGGAQYLTDKFITCPDGHKEGAFKDATFSIRLDGEPVIRCSLVAENAQLRRAWSELSFHANILACAKSKQDRDRAALKVFCAIGDATDALPELRTLDQAQRRVPQGNRSRPAAPVEEKTGHRKPDIGKGGEMNIHKPAPSLKEQLDYAVASGDIAGARAIDREIAQLADSVVSELEEGAFHYDACNTLRFRGDLAAILIRSALRRYTKEVFAENEQLKEEKRLCANSIIETCIRYPNVSMYVLQLETQITHMDEARKNLEIGHCNQPDMVKAKDSEIMALAGEIARLKESCRLAGVGDYKADYTLGRLTETGKLRAATAALVAENAKLRAALAQGGGQ